MTRYTFALFVALLIHLLLIVLFWVLGTMVPESKKQIEPKESKIIISLKDIPKKHKESAPIKEKQKQSKIAPPMPKGSQLKKIVKKPPIKYKEHKPAKEIKLNSKPKVESSTPPKPYIPLLAKKQIKEQNLTKTTPIKKESTNPLYAMLSQDKSTKEVKKKLSNNSLSSSINSNIKELYGEKFGELSVGQQEYILDNQEIMRRITQQVLTRQAQVTDLRKINVNRDNVIEFYLHPNGDMSDFRFLKKTGYFVLDDITKATIDYAYSKYPRPKEKTLIRYNVFFNLSRY